MTPWVVFDYGMVLTTAQPDSVWPALAAVGGGEPEAVRQGYWDHRDPYDRGLLTASDYWARVFGRRVDEVVAELDRLDVESWMHLRPEVVSLVSRLDARVALLSNAPLSLGEALDAAEWARVFEHRVFSARLRVAKPDAEIYERLLGVLGADARDVTFVDDRPENIEGARAVGLAGVVFTDAAQLASELA